MTPRGIIRRSLLQLAAIGLAAGIACPARADVALNGIFSDHMVLQRDVRLPIWGTAEPGEAVAVTLGGHRASTTADASGRWRVELDALAAGGPLELVATGRNVVDVQDILVGEVWLCSGQSNMAYTMSSLRRGPYAKDLESADDPLIRQGKVPNRPSVEPADDVPVKWTACSKETVGGFSAAGYYFARELRRELDVPVGIVLSAWGGTSAESWTSREALATVPDFRERAERQLADLQALPGRILEFPAALEAWERRHDRIEPENLGEPRGWAAPDADTSGWSPVRLNTPWKEAGLPDGGVAWLRYAFEVPPEAAGRDFRLDLGFVEEQRETTYFNGEKLGQSGRKPPEFTSRYVGYNVPGRLVRPGRNVVAVRFVADLGDRAGIARRADALGFRALGLKGLPDDALTRVEARYPPLPPGAIAGRPACPKGDSAHTSGNLYYGMIRPLIPFAIRGVVWYQGEQDAGRAYRYRTLLPLMIRDWRAAWGREDLPFLIQQLPNWQAVRNQPEESDWAEMREAQAMTARDLPHCGIACAIEIGDPDDVHPPHKREIGRRLSLVALAKVYERPVEYSGPEYDSMAVEGPAIRLRFRHAGGLASSDGRPLRRFAVAGEDRRFAWADARIDGESVVVSSPEVPRPVAARYAWASSPEGCNLTNAAGLPAFPFRTDTWPGRTENRK